MNVVFKKNTANFSDVKEHLLVCDNQFIPRLSSTIDISEYAKKLIDKASLLEAWDGDVLIGLIAFYNNSLENEYYITNVSVLDQYRGNGVAKSLLQNIINLAMNDKIARIQLEVNKLNEIAINLYNKNGFNISSDRSSNTYLMIKSTNMNRDYDKEFLDTNDHKYSYNFDFDVMHHYMLKSFIPFFREGKLLELGSYKGDFTEKFLPHFNDITCIEASGEAVKTANSKFNDRVKIINGLFETVELNDKFENIVLTHVLEHISDPVAVLKKVNDEWLSDNGRFFLVCPNANAPSRQIAVKMGLITHNSAITLAEKEHGHQITYTLDTLERDARLAGLKVVYRSGIFFKALANFQWDRLLNTDIISKEYLEGCYQLGQQYPDLCSSIFLMCEKGK